LNNCAFTPAQKLNHNKSKSMEANLDEDKNLQNQKYIVAHKEFIGSSSITDD